MHLSYPGTRETWVSDGAVISRTVHVAAGQEVLASLYQPPVDVANQSWKSAWMECRQDNHPAGELARMVRPQQPQRITVLLSRNVPQDFRDTATSGTAGSPQPTPPPVLQRRRSRNAAGPDAVRAPRRRRPGTPTNLPFFAASFPSANGVPIGWVTRAMTRLS